MKLKVVRDQIDSETEEMIELEEGTEVKAVLKRLGVPKEEVLVAADGEIVSGEARLEDVSELKIMDVIAGG